MFTHEQSSEFQHFFSTTIFYSSCNFCLLLLLYFLDNLERDRGINACDGRKNDLMCDVDNDDDVDDDYEDDEDDDDVGDSGKPFT